MSADPRSPDQGSTVDVQRPAAGSRNEPIEGDSLEPDRLGDRSLARIDTVFSRDAQAAHAAERRELERRLAALPPDAVQERAELARSASLQRFLEDTLKDEPRLPERMDPRCGVAVVVPAYAERERIVQFLSSLADQHGVDPSMFEAIVVVNNPPAAPDRQPEWTDADYARKLALYEDAVPNNQETLALIEWLRDPARPAPQMADEERVELERIRASGVRIQAIDKASPGRTFIADEANVGAARNYGVAAAIERFHDHAGRNGIIVQTDADSRLDPEYIATVMQLYAQDPSLIGATGQLEFALDDASDAFAKRVTTYQELIHQLWKVSETYRSRGAAPAPQQPSDEQTRPARMVHFSGANMTSRAFEAAYVGGLKKSLSRDRADGGEDPDFGYRLETIGKVAKVPTLRVTTADRESARTAVWAGAGQQRIKLMHTLREHGAVMAKRPSDVTELLRMEGALRAYIGVPATTGADILRSAVFRGTPLLTVDEAELVAMSFRRATSAEDLRADPSLATIRDAVQQRSDALAKEVPIEQAIDELVAEMREDAAVRPEYDRAYGELVAEDTARATSRRELLQRFVDLGFHAGTQPATPAALLTLLTAHAEELQLDQNALARLGDRKDVLGEIVATLGAPTIEAAQETAATKLASLVAAPEAGSLEDQARKLRALDRALEWA